MENERVPHQPRRGDMFIERPAKKVIRSVGAAFWRVLQGHAAPLGLGVDWRWCL